jgi:hypothetical protein
VRCPQLSKRSRHAAATSISACRQRTFAIPRAELHPGANAIAEAPAWLLAKIAPSNGTGNSTTPPSEWRELVKGISEGARDCSLTKLTGHLLRRHVDPFVTLELIRVFNATRCTPPLPDKDIERIVASVAGLELRRRQAGNG